jgi:hypothetical protein
MAAPTPESCAGEVDKSVAKYETFAAQVGKLDKTYAKMNGEYRLIAHALWQGSDVIKELGKQLADSIATFNKMTPKGEALRKQMQSIGIMARDYMKELKTYRSDLEEVQGGCEAMLKANKDSKVLKTAKTDAALKSLESNYGMLDLVAQECAGISKLPDLPA